MTTFAILPPLKRGDTWSFSFAWSGITDFTGCTARQQIRTIREHKLVASISTTDYITVDAITFTLYSNFPSTLTSLVPPGQYLTDQELTLGDGTVISSQTLQLVIEEDITQ